MEKMDNPHVVICLLVLSALAICIHGFGAIILTLQQRYEENIQQTLLINLSCVEVLANIFRILYTNFHVLFKDPIKRVEVYLDVFNLSRYCLIIANTGVHWLYIVSLTYITVNRLLEIVLNIKYQIYCTIKRVKILIVISWVMTVLLCVVLCIVDATKEFLILVSMDHYMVYVSAVLEFLFLLLAIFTYAFIFLKFVESRRQPSIHPNIQKKTEKPLISDTVSSPDYRGIWNIFCNSSFYVYFILTLNVVLFNGLPQLVFFFLYNDEKAEEGNSVHTHSYGHVVMFKDIFVVLSDIFDVTIYIMLDGNVRQRLKKMMCRRRRNQIANLSRQG